jgi:hypothetical protein
VTASEAARGGASEPAGAIARRERFLVALVLGLVAGHFALTMARTVDVPRDIEQFWFAARTLLHGGDPYAAIGPGRAFQYPWPLVYPLPASVALIPLAWLTGSWACGVFMALSAGAFAWALMEHGWAPLLAFFSICVWHAAGTVQWSPLLAASFVLAPLSVVYVAKPTIGAALFVARPSWWAVGGAVALTAVAFLLDPGWVSAWRDAVARALVQAKHGFPYRAPVLMPGGVLVLVALARWRRAEARLLVALACVPHTLLPYEAVPLFLVPRGWLQCAALVALSHVAWWWVARHMPFPDFYATVIAYTKTITVLMYLPAAAMVLARPNVGTIPPSLERLVARWPARLRGSAH